MVALASSKEEVLEFLKNDIYAKNEVWDFSKVSYSRTLKMGGQRLMLIGYRSKFILSNVHSGLHLLEVKEVKVRMKNEIWL
jgi:hypothetical protein